MLTLIAVYLPCKFTFVNEASCLSYEVISVDRCADLIKVLFIFELLLFLPFEVLTDYFIVFLSIFNDWLNWRWKEVMLKLCREKNREEN